MKLAETPFYILGGKDEHEAVESDAASWAQWFHENRLACRVGLNHFDNVTISTVFLGLDHNFNGGHPHLFETMLFYKKDSVECCRCTTWTQALDQHKHMIEFARNSLPR